MKGLLNKLRQEGVVRSQWVYDTMLKVDRADFIEKNPYFDNSQYLGYNVVISAPHMHAYALEYLSPALTNFRNFNPKNFRILDIGSGSGYLTVCLSKLIDDEGIVVGIEHIPELFLKGKRNIQKHHKNLLDDKKIILLNLDGRNGYKELGPYQLIHVGAAAEKIPQVLVDQLAKGGRMFIPIGLDPDNQYIYVVDKDLNGNVTYKKTISVCYVLLTSKEKQLRGEC
jgi:protein-L-isoaspartate(D-aspartate) O-methyltransferase